jgi:rubrerythrin
MSLGNNKTSLLYRFSVNENKISLLYGAYSERFPEREKLWQGLAKDEKRHSALLADLDERFKEELENWQISDNAPAILDYISNFIDACLDRVGEVSLKEALNNSLSLEQSMIEKKSFEIFSSANPEIVAVLEKLNRETEGHRRWLLKYIQDEI